MAEVPQFDPALKKVVKKKKKEINLDEVATAGTAGAEGAEPGDIPEFDPSAKKKPAKKKVTVKIGDEDAVKTREDEEAPKIAAFDPNAKKRKKKEPVAVLKELVTVAGDAAPAGEGDATAAYAGYPYDILLGRVFEIMHAKNPELIAGEKKRFIMKPPNVVRAGTKRTAFQNFSEICKLMKRPHKHVLSFILAELGTTGSIDILEQLILRGRYQGKQLENVLRKYIKEYVTCHTCRSPDTEMQKHDRLYFLQCGPCGSRCSVVSIKTGFQAQIGRRAAQRAKTA